jgi:putative FmdB family regulatory protein
MPIYSFECLTCRHEFEEALPFEDYEKKEREGFTCPRCQSKEVEQLILASTLHTSKKSQRSY